jgi:stearoyl-CoA desaturase (delta-9 desaturase)
LSEVSWFRVLPFLLMHVACVSVLWVGWSWTAVAVAAVIYVARVFGLAAFYHRYFSHRTFKTSRAVQFVGALLGNAAGQRGPIWWSAHHRFSDTNADVYSPHRQGFLYSHMLWFMTRDNYATRSNYVKDWLKYPELRLMDRLDFLAPALLAIGTFSLGFLLRRYVPELSVTGGQMFVWGFLVSTVALYHVTFFVNSLAYKLGRQRFPTGDQSRNNVLLAMITMGEGWHNNHHFYPNAARQGFFWWEVDVTYYLLRAMAWCGLVWDLKTVPARVLTSAAKPSAKSPAY